MSNRYIELFLQSDPPEEAAPIPPSRNAPARSAPAFHPDDIETDSLFSRRGGGGGNASSGSSMTSSAYDGFYGTVNKFSGTGGSSQQRQYF